jgi:hypothetical protein
MRHRIDALMAALAPSGTHVRIEGGLPLEGPAPATGEAVDALECEKAYRQIALLSLPRSLGSPGFWGQLGKGGSALRLLP